MYEPIVDNTGPNLGKLAVWTRTRDRDDNAVMTPLWRLQNGQGPSWKYAQANIDSDKDYQVRQLAEFSIHTFFLHFGISPNYFRSFSRACGVTIG